MDTSRLNQVESAVLEMFFFLKSQSDVMSTASCLD